MRAWYAFYTMVGAGVILVGLMVLGNAIGGVR